MITARTDVRKARAKVQNIGKNVRGTLVGVLESEARICAVSLAKSTQPYGTGNDAKLAGEKAVARDIARVYRTPDRVFAELSGMPKNLAAQFYKLMQLGKYGAASQVLQRARTAYGRVPISRFDGGSLHIQRRSMSAGRVYSTKPGMIVTDSKRLGAYTAMIVDRVGWAKSAFAAIARELGGIRGLRAPKLAGGERDITANWITRKNAPHQIDRQYSNRARPVITLTSKVPYADHVLPASARRQAINIAFERLQRQLEIAARYEMRAAA